ncbi:unnamed protein product [Trichobilharzia regenti]|nr:unnamed protein product [Trichobilharzia regenti]
MELAKLRIVQIEKEAELESLRQANRKCSGHNKSPNKPPTSHTGLMAMFREKSRLINLKLKFYQESRAEDIYWKGDELLKEEFPEDSLVIEESREVREALERLKDLAKKRQKKLLEAYEIQRFFRDTDKAISWVNERSIPLSIEDCGRDLASVQALKRKHEALERDLTALDEKIVQLGDDTKVLAQKHPESQDTIQGKCDALITT